MTEPTLRQIEQQSVQSKPHVNGKDGAPPNDFWFGVTERGPLLSAYGTLARKRELLAYYRHPYNGMVQSAFAGMTKKWASTEHKIGGQRNRVRYEQVFERANFGEGYEAFIQKVGLDFLRFDDGAYIELIYPGPAMRPPTGGLSGIAHLDNLRCRPTGDPQFPVLYEDRKGRLHLMHESRVLHLVDAPDGDERHPGYGICALSRAIALVTQQIAMMRYIESNLDDQPLPGYMVASNLNEGQRNAAFERYRQEQSNDSKPVWGRTIWLYSLDPSAPTSLTPVSYAQAPENWNYKEYSDIHVNALALALGVDVQELWQLTGGTLGSGQQSMVLHAKSQNKTFGAFLRLTEPKFSAALPVPNDFAYVDRDPYAIQDEALAAQGWAGALSTVKDDLTRDERRAVYARMIPAVAAEITDDAGNVKPYTPAPDEIEPPAGEQPPGNAGPRADSENPRRLALLERRAGERKAVKDASRDDFKADFAALVAAVRAGQLTEREAEIRLRALVREYGAAAYLAGLAESGVIRDAPTESDQSALLLLLVAAIPFIRKFIASLFAEAPPDMEMDGDDDFAGERADLWWQKTIGSYRDGGRLDGNPDARYIFGGSDGLESCTTCQRLKGVALTMADWTRFRLRPGVDTANFDCGGWHCEHRLIPVA